ncbi:amidase family protein [Litoribaculum gwangyangense]
MNRFILFLVSIAIISCKNPAEGKPITETVSDTTSVKDFREFKVLDSKYISNEDLWSRFNEDLKDFSDADYNSLKPLILEQDIPTIQKHVYSGDFSYELLTKFYLYRIRKFDRENELSLNSVISINPNVIEDAKLRDRELLNRKLKHPIFGMPILLKDNINAFGAPTTAGAVALQNNNAEDAFITKRLKEQGAIILGKANLSEWAYFFCGDCPSGYSAIGGQTLNPYGRRIMDTGGSSSGSGVAVATNFSVAAVGSETSGSILSPSSQNSIVGLKPTIGLLSRSGIVPISSTLDTPGPMTKNVTDNAILLDAMLGFDNSDSKSIEMDRNGSMYDAFESASLQGKRFGAFKRLLEDSLYVQAISNLKSNGAEVIEIDEQEISLPNFRRLLNLDMKKDLPIYLSEFASKDVAVKSVLDVVEFNKKDSLNIMPYGQRLFEGIVNDEGDALFLERIQDTLKTNGRQYFDIPMKTQNLDGFLSINNYHAGFAAVAEYPAITVPMGYAENGAPKGLTFISKPLSEKQLLNWAYVYEQTSKRRKPPVNYN